LNAISNDSYTSGQFGLLAYVSTARFDNVVATTDVVVPGPVVTTTITYTYDALYRVTDVVYSTGEEFHYQYDSVGNVLQYTRTVSGQTVVTTYTYNEANQLAI